ncbi:hypothetical protein BDY24DRAFT_444153 [Mrakia frigida]|uniref:uncharacterized protein n=1 Tax=Mrakia frigida TaxID=29902 RepID=UPI003FCC0778
MSLRKPRLLVLGITGYVGSSLLPYLSRDAFEILTIHRSPYTSNLLQSAGIHSILGDFTDLELIEKTSSEVDIVLLLAKAEVIEFAQAVGRGLMKRVRDGKTGGRKPCVIRLSGAESFVRESGVRAEGERLSDLPGSKLADRISWNHPMALTDRMLIQTGSLSLITTKIVFAGLVYGRSPSRIGYQVASIVNLALARRCVEMISDGTGRWPSIHVQSLCKFLSHLLIDVANNPNQANGSGSEGLYFASTSEHEQKELLEAIASKLHLQNLVDSPNLKVVAPNHVLPLFGRRGSLVFGGDAPFEPARARLLVPDWEKGTASLWDSLPMEMAGVFGVRQRGR